MRRTVLVTMVLANLTVSVESARAETSFGIKGGLVRASLDVEGPGAFSTSPDSGGTIGAFVGLDLSKSVRLQPEVLFTKAKFSSRELVSPFGIAARSVEVPLLFQVKILPERRVQVVLYSGPRLGFLSKVTESIEGVDVDISDQLKGVDAGIVLGGGLETAVGRGALVVEARYNIGLRNLDEAPDDTFKSGAFLALVGYRF